MNQGDADLLNNLITRLIAANDTYRKSEYRGQIMRFADDFVRGREEMSAEDIKRRVKSILEDRQAAFMSCRMMDVDACTDAVVALVRELSRPVIQRRRIQSPPPPPTLAPHQPTDPFPQDPDRPRWEL